MLPPSLTVLHGLAPQHAPPNRLPAHLTVNLVPYPSPLTLPLFSPRSKDQAVVEYLEPLMEATPETRASLVHEAQASKWLAAAANGHLSEVNNMLTLQEIDPNLTSYAGGGRTAFMLAAEAGHEVRAALRGGGGRATRRHGRVPATTGSLASVCDAGVSPCPRAHRP